jgi:hypothetical protein
MRGCGKAGTRQGGALDRTKGGTEKAAEPAVSVAQFGGNGDATPPRWRGALGAAVIASGGADAIADDAVGSQERCVGHTDLLPLNRSSRYERLPGQLAQKESLDEFRKAKAA